MPFGEYNELHHRWYPANDTPSNLMLVHSFCHKAIHFGGRVKVTSRSLAGRGDIGIGDNRIWRAYLARK